MTESAGKMAESCWEVERQSCGQVFRPYYVVILRNKQKAGSSIVKASSSDAESVSLLVDQLRGDLMELTDDEFVTKYELGAA
jgi:hypothetical protein